MTSEHCPDHPDIARAMREGDPEGEAPVCPICGAECMTLYISADSEVRGCDECLTAVSADEYDERWWTA